jgi:hypothetical protein
MSKSLLRFLEDDPDEAAVSTVSSYEKHEKHEFDSKEVPVFRSNSCFSYTDNPQIETSCKAAGSPNEPHERGKELLAPFLPVIQAAHRSELPAVPLTWARAGELNGYVCAIAAGIWYGHTLDEPTRLAAHLENLRRLQAAHDRVTP